MLDIRSLLLVALLAASTHALPAADVARAEPATLPWRILIANDNCPDVTWGFPEAQVRQAFADLIRAHLDEMHRTDTGPIESRDHYNVMAFVEAEAFLEKHPERKDEFVRRVREGRIGLSPFLCNTLWGFQSTEGVLRAFYPARRFEREHHVPLEVAGHTELPSLPWGMATLLSGCGVRWTSVPFLDYDCTFQGLTNPPLFRFAGPDGSEVRVVLDAWASRKANYRQGGFLLEDTRRVTAEWIPHYETLGTAWPLRILLASGTHSDIHPDSWKQARGFADGIARYNAAGTDSVKLVNGTLAQFCREVDAAEQQRPFLPVVRGCFGHSWELWPVSLARTVAALRENERAFLAAESLLAIAAQTDPTLAAQTRAERQRAEWCWAMLGDHAWNGTDPANKRHNAHLRRSWADCLGNTARDLTKRGWESMGLRSDPRALTVFNPTSFARDILVVCDAPEPLAGVRTGRESIESSRFREGGRDRIRFVARNVPAFGFRQYQLVHGRSKAEAPPFHADGCTLEGPFYRLTLDPATGGLTSLVHRATGQELVFAGSGRTLAQTVFWDGQEHRLEHVRSQVNLDGCCAELQVAGDIGDIRITNRVTLYAKLDRVDFEILVHKPATTNEQRLLHFFPAGDGSKDLWIETTAAVLRPRLQPEGDLLPGADPRRFAVQGFVDCSPPGRAGVTVTPHDSFMLRLDQDALAFEALGNDQNWKEVTQDQDGMTDFRFRYSLRAHPPGFDPASALVWSRDVTAPLVCAAGRIDKKWLNRSWLEADPSQAVVTCFKPADDGAPGQVVARLWEIAGEDRLLSLRAPGYHSAWECDLLERDRGSLNMKGGALTIALRRFGFVGVSLER